MIELLKEILGKFKGADWWIVIVALVIGYGTWEYTSKSGPAQSKFLRQVAAVTLVAAVAVAVIVVRQRRRSIAAQFSVGVTGILVLRLDGDDEKHSGQRRLVAKLDDELHNKRTDAAATPRKIADLPSTHPHLQLPAKAATPRKIEVHASEKSASLARGEDQGHDAARKIGRKARATLVLWGTISEIQNNQKEISPRLTISHSLVSGEQPLDATMIMDVKLPRQLTNQPIAIAQFAAALAAFSQGDYPTALIGFELALQFETDIPADDLADIRYYGASTAQRLPPFQILETIEWLLHKVIEPYEAILPFYEQRSREVWAGIQNNLGNAYADLPTLSDKAAKATNLQQAIAAYQAASSVRTEKDFPIEWAMTQYNLGLAYFNLRTSGAVNLQYPIADSANFEQAIAAFHAALRVFTKKSFPYDWAKTYYTLGNAYAGLPSGDRAANLEQAIHCYENAFTIWTPAAFPNDHQNARWDIMFARGALEQFKNVTELLATYERRGLYFGSVRVTIGTESRTLEFGVSVEDHEALRNIFQTHLSHLDPTRDHYFIPNSMDQIDEHRAEIQVRIENDRYGTKLPFGVPFSLAKTLCWFANQSF